MNSFSAHFYFYYFLLTYMLKNIGVKTNDKEVGIDYAEITFLEEKNFTKLSIVFLESSDFRFDESINISFLVKTNFGFEDTRNALEKYEIKLIEVIRKKSNINLDENIKVKLGQLYFLYFPPLPKGIYNVKLEFDQKEVSIGPFKNNNLISLSNYADSEYVSYEISLPNSGKITSSEKNLSDLLFNSEDDVRNYLNNNKIDPIEGIWETITPNGGSYRVFIIKEDYKYVGKIIDEISKWKFGDTKFFIETAAVENILSFNWILNDRKTTIKRMGTLKDGFWIEMLQEKLNLYKVFPKLNSSRNTRGNKWSGNGSGLIISKSGYIITNHHVIEEAEEIEVEFILNQEVQKFNAEIVNVDKVNDLAIIKIFDMNFDGVDDLPYNFKTRTSDVGTKVYAYGYPMALTIMGKEIKITDGIISSKSGYDGDITTYQITAPIQGGNSGGPLFDENANLLGINSSGLNKEIADNVGYTIKSSYILNLIDVLPKNIELPTNDKLKSLPLTEQIKEISKFVVLIKVK